MRKLKRAAKHFNGLTLGLDLHRKFVQYSILNAGGDELANGRIDSSAEALGKLVAQWRDRGPLQAAIEASGCFIWVYDLLAGMIGREHIHAAHPAKIKAIANSDEKNDENDAWWLAYLLYDCRLPKSFVAEGELRDLRIAAREWRDWTDRRSDLIRRMRSHLAQCGLALPKAFLSSRRKRDQAREVIKQVGGARRLALKLLWKEMRQISRAIRRLRAAMERLCGKFKEVRHMQAEMPGFGPLLSGAVYGELGAPQRFGRAKSYAKATGLTPGYRESGGKNMGGTITRAGSRLARWAFTRAVIICLRCKKGAGARVKAWVQWHGRHRIKKKVIVAAARKLAEGMWRLFALGEAFNLERAFPVPAQLAQA